MSVNSPNQAKGQSQRSADLANAQNALNRAAAKARDIARKTGTAIVIFENGEIREERGGADAHPER